MDVSRVGAQVLGWLQAAKDVALDLLEPKIPDGGYKVRDEVPQTINFALNLIGAPELPEPDKALAMEGLEGLLALVSAENTEARVKAATALAQKLLPGVASKVAEQVGQKATGNFVLNLAQGMVKWVTKNPDQAGWLAADIARVIATAVATAGASLATDLPAVMPKLVAATSGILKEAGVSPEKLLGDIATDLLKFLGVDEVQAEKWGAATGSLMALGADVALAVATKGQHKINPELVKAAASSVATVVGAPPDTATLIATSAAMAFTLGQNFAGFVLAGNPVETFGGFDKVFKSAGEAAKEAVKLYMGQEGASVDQVARKVKDLLPLFQSFTATVTKESSAANPAFGNVGWDAFMNNLQTWIGGLATQTTTA